MRPTSRSLTTWVCDLIHSPVCSVVDLGIGSDESNRCPNIWLEDKYLPGLKATSQEFMEKGQLTLLTNWQTVADED